MGDSVAETLKPKLQTLNPKPQTPKVKAVAPECSDLEANGGLVAEVRPPFAFSARI